MESLYINHLCIACDACREVCPTSAISVQEPIYHIESNLCIMCNGYSSQPLCIEVCPVDAIIIKNY
ncbi:4Fe-4S dicluster domain-containing protein [Helicobacter saguini]|uniref:4Fe-4S dicluster domain-containing protein n=2 Tax=Helicobacter saguini TaxID=1548018 RepID=A0A347W7C3_9HELI|nr:4Fe-4S binding protein [Helicobacter saguini]MWV61464.1 4Fe-4S dicluster domain-containing protein [Helicobacter saguini]MWV67864.1 4Fe-4S dicluster domain-containing protein [Helicobacter saguini]MWV70666.1 4Fe-4S dicluster domain-containing protein [Helicobacter saguini]MWV72571.1 4Fe-4S dicluster domain-containing protein [Helicobacter saguini]TLD94820.1 4Fe-4S dicluster domain-containing protein [Helicobacter saguini]